MIRKLCYALIIIIASVGAGCATTKPYNPFKISQDEFHNKVKTIALAPIWVPTDLQDPEPVKAKFETLIEAKLKEEGFSVIPSREYAAIEASMKEKVGGYFNPITGKVDESKFKEVRENTAEELATKFKADALLYSFIGVRKIHWSGARAGWDGTSEAIIPTGQAIVEALFLQRSGTTAALSLVISINDIKGKNLFFNAGGIQLLTKLSGSDFVTVPRGQLFVDEERNINAVKIALEPLAKKSEKEAKPKP